MEEWLMRKEYNKLVRDRIPEIIRQDGRQCGIKVIPKKDYIQALKNKLVEEAEEAATANHENLIKELADLYEVIDSLIVVQEIDREAILAEQERRRINRGSFRKRICLLWTD